MAERKARKPRKLPPTTNAKTRKMADERAPRDRQVVTEDGGIIITNNPGDEKKWRKRRVRKEEGK